MVVHTSNPSAVEAETHAFLSLRPTGLQKEFQDSWAIENPYHKKQKQTNKKKRQGLMWPQIHNVTKDDLDLLLTLRPPNSPVLGSQV